MLTRVEDGFRKYAKPWPTDQGGGSGLPHYGLAGPELWAMSSPHVILSVTTPGFGHNEDMYGFWSIWCFSVIRCSWNGKSTKLMELVSNNHLSSISWMKCRYVGGKYVYFMTTNNTPVVDLCNAIHQRKCKEWQKGGPLVTQPSMKSLCVGTGRYLCKVYNYHDSEACGYKWYGILPRIEGMVMVWSWNGFGCVFGLAVWSIESPCGSRYVVYFLIQLDWVV
jgi:hypothetical protein